MNSYPWGNTEHCRLPRGGDRYTNQLGCKARKSLLRPQCQQRGISSSRVTQSKKWPCC